MRRLTGLVLVGVLAFTFVGSPASRAATVASSWPVGPQPFGLAIDEQTGKVYVANSGGAAPDGSGRISVVDPATGSVDTIRTSLTPNLVLVDSVGRRLYSSNANLNTNARSLDVFDLDTRASVANLPVGGYGMALDRAAGRLYVCESGSLKVIDTPTLAVVASATAPASTWWFRVAADPDRHHLYVTNIRETSPTFFVLDDRDLTTLAEIPFATATRFAVTVDPGTHFVFVAGGQWDGQAMASALSVIDPDTLSVTQRTSLPGFAVGIALAPSRHRIYVSDNTGYRLYGIDDTTLGIAETMRLEFPPGELLMHPDRRLYVGNHNTSSQSASTLVALDLNNHAPVFLSLSLTPSIAFTGDTLRADARAYDPDLAPTIAGNPVSYTYEWSRNGNVLPGAGSPSLDLSVPGRRWHAPHRRRIRRSDRRQHGADGRGLADYDHTDVEERYHCDGRQPGSRQRRPHVRLHMAAERCRHANGNDDVDDGPLRPVGQRQRRQGRHRQRDGHRDRRVIDLPEREHQRDGAQPLGLLRAGRRPNRRIVGDRDSRPWGVQQGRQEARVTRERLEVAGSVEILAARENRDYAGRGIAASGHRRDDAASAAGQRDADRASFEIGDDRCAVLVRRGRDGAGDLAMPDDLVRDARAGDELEATPWDGHVDEGGVARNDFERGIGEESECPRTESGREREGRLSQRADKARPRYEPAAKEAHRSEPRTDPDERHDPDAVSTDAKNRLADRMVGAAPERRGHDR